MIGKLIGQYLDRTAAEHLKAAREYVRTNTFPSGDFSWSPLSKAQNRLAKRAIDFYLSVTAAVALMPIILVMVPAVKITAKGPLLEKETRVGKDNQDLSIYKFRVTEPNESDVPASSPTRPKLNALGLIVAPYALDEIPQLWPVITGEMSMLGPRALPREILFKDTNPPTWEEHRHRIPPALGNICAILSGGKAIRSREEYTALETYYLGTWSASREMEFAFRGLLIVMSGRH
ncbi:MAG: sugar transferase [Candidatus Saganbacteria bacterium]|nr:sugar transferase [Candidatus Saganbacteria bacterium]